MTRAVLLLLVATILSLPLSGCGRKGAPRPPGPPNQVIYPKGYPTE